MRGKHLAVMLAAIGFLAMAAASTSAQADTTTLVCSVEGVAAPVKITLDEAKSTVTIQYPPNTVGGVYFPATAPVTYSAKFSPDTITFVGGGTSTYPNGEPETIDRQTGVFVRNGVVWTCRVSQKQF